MKKIKENFKILFPLIILIIFFVIYLLYNSGVNEKVTRVVLKDNLFEQDFFDEKNREKNLIPGRFDVIDYSEGYQYFDWVDSKQILISTRDSEEIYKNLLGKPTHYFQMSILNTVNGAAEKVKTMENKDQMIISVSPDRKKVVYRKEDEVVNFKQQDKKGKEKTEYMQELNTNPNEVQLTQTGFLQWMPDGSGYIGFDSNLYFYDFKTNSKTIVIEKRKMEKLGVIEKIEISRDGKNIVFKTSSKFEKDENSLYSLELENPEKIKLLVQGCIENFELLDRDNLILNGVIQNKRGLYYFNVTKEWNTILLNGNIKYFSLSKDKKMIAYIKKQENEEEDMYAAKLNKNEIQSPIILYKNIFLKLYSIRWSDDNKRLLFSLAEEKNEKKQNQSLCIFTLK